MRRRKAGGKAAKTQRSKTSTRRNALKTARRRSAPVAGKQTTAAQLARELHEAREQQTASAEVLKVISGSTFDLQGVLDTLIATATRLCGADMGILRRRVGAMYELAATYGLKSEWGKLIADHPNTPGRHSIIGRSAAAGQSVQVADVLQDAEYVNTATQKLIGFRAVLVTPMLRDKNLIGTLGFFKLEPGLFSQKQVAVIESFAAQAVIAIENVRLVTELRHRTDDLSEALEQQTATSEVLKVVSSSPGDMKPVFEAMLANALRICDAKFGHILLYDGERYHAAYLHEVPSSYREFWEQHGPIRPGPNTGLARLARTKQVSHIPDLKADATYAEREPLRVVTVEQAGARSLLAVPMLKENDLIGAIVIYRQEVRPFTDKQIELVKNFAAQAVIAIENTRLLNELRQRTHELATSLNNLRTTQDRLLQTQKLASLGQLTAGIAHEIKNPLNFVNNFSGISAELIGELQDTLSGISIDPEKHAEIKELTDTLRGNLEKVVHHGKRADTIVKSMLLHSGQSSGEHRSIDINALVEESLNRAYYGARAEERGFNIKLERSFDPAAGEVDLFPREITRALLNLISNGFYAATKRKAEVKVDDHEPTLIATTKNLGDHVEIRIRDNGTGIPADVREKMFDPFFTTKPAGEGTGLGLSISHDIIVKQHGGSIEVDTEPGEFAEIRVILPRTAASLLERS